MKHYPILIQEAGTSQEKQNMLCDPKMTFEREKERKNHPNQTIKNLIFESKQRKYLLVIFMHWGFA